MSDRPPPASSLPHVLDEFAQCTDGAQCTEGAPSVCDGTSKGGAARDRDAKAGENAKAGEQPTSLSAITATHDVLFKEAARTSVSCDVCGDDVEAFDYDDPTKNGFDVPGKGFYLTSRGTERRYEETALCGLCAAAIGVTVWMRWELEEE